MLIPKLHKGLGISMVQKVSTKSREEGVLENPMPVLPFHTYKTSSGYQFRVVVPKPLRGLIGKREIKKILAQTIGLPVLKRSYCL